MAEFVRKKRFYRYKDEQCKKFLSRDFSKKCAYCKIREGDLAGPDSFEKDHFFPLKKGGEDGYDNLYYSCRSCNGKSGKSDKWSETLLDPCKDDIWDVHVKVDDNFKCKELTEQGKEYKNTFKLNRKSYVNIRRKIANHQSELHEKVAKYKQLSQELIALGPEAFDVQYLTNDIHEWERILEYGVNYRMSENAFDEDVDERIFCALAEVGIVECVDRDYDLFYEISIGDNKYLCYVEMVEFDLGVNGSARKFISTEKLSVWRNINKQEKILIILYNSSNQQVYFVKLDDVLESSGAKNEDRCGYSVTEENHISKLNIVS